MSATDGDTFTFPTPTAGAGRAQSDAQRPLGTALVAPGGSAGAGLTSDSFIGPSVSAAVCPTVTEQEKGAEPRWQRSVAPEDGASREAGSHEAEQMPGAAPSGEAGLEAQLGPGRPPSGRGAKRDQ